MMVAQLPYMTVTSSIFVSPRGSDAADGTAGYPVATIQRARALASASASKLVTLLPGTHALSAPLVLDERDSGVSWVAEQGASISGGVDLTGWSLAPFESAEGTPVFQTDVSGVAGAQDRHLFVQGQRAKRPRMDEAAAAALFLGHSMTEDGFTLAAGAPPWPRNGSGVEFVYPQV